MFQSALRPKNVSLSTEDLTVALESCIQEVQTKTALLERLAFAREAFLAIPSDDVSSLTVSMFASTFYDVEQQFIPETSNKSLESSLASTGRKAKAFALESGDGVISRIWQYIKDLVSKIVNFVKDLFKRNKDSTKKAEDTRNDLAKSIEKVSKSSQLIEIVIPKSNSFAGFVVDSKINFDTVKKVLDQMRRNVDEAEAISTKLERIKFDVGSHFGRVDGLDSAFSDKDRVYIYPDSDYPGENYAYFDIESKTFKLNNETNQASLTEAEIVARVGDWVVKRDDVFLFADKTSVTKLRDQVNSRLLIKLSDITKNIEQKSNELEQQIVDNNRKAVSAAFTKTSSYSQEELDYKNSELQLKISAFKQLLETVNSFTKVSLKISNHVSYLDYSSLSILEVFNKKIIAEAKD